jgi:hypothetical protein
MVKELTAWRRDSKRYAIRCWKEGIPNEIKDPAVAGSFFIAVILFPPAVHCPITNVLNKLVSAAFPSILSGIFHPY